MEKIELHNNKSRISITGPQEAMDEMVVISREPGTTQAIRALIDEERVSFDTFQELKTALYAKATELKAKKIHIVVDPVIKVDSVFSAALVTIIHPDADLVAFNSEVAFRGYYIGCAPKDDIDAVNLSRTESMSSFMKALHTFKDSLELRPGAFESLIDTKLVHEIGRCDAHPAPFNVETPFYYAVIQFQRMWSEVWERDCTTTNVVTDLMRFTDAVRMTRLMLIRYIETANAYADSLNYTKETIKNRPNRHHVVFEKTIMPSIIPEESRDGLIFAIPSVEKGRWVLVSTIPSARLSFSESQIKSWLNSFPIAKGIEFKYPDPQTLVIEGALSSDKKTREVVDYLIKCADTEAAKILSKVNANLS